MKYAKYKTLYLFKNLKNDMNLRKKYSHVLVYSLSYPYCFFCWFSYQTRVFFFKRSQFLNDDTIIYCVVIKTDSNKAARDIARNLTKKELKRIFNKYNSIVL